MNSESHAFSNHAGGCIIRKKNGSRIALHNDQCFSFTKIQRKDSAHSCKTFGCGILSAQYPERQFYRQGNGAVFLDFFNDGNGQEDFREIGKEVEASRARPDR